MSDVSLNKVKSKVDVPLTILGEAPATLILVSVGIN